MTLSGPSGIIKQGEKFNLYNGTMYTSNKKLPFPAPTRYSKKEGSTHSFLSKEGRRQKAVILRKAEGSIDTCSQHVRVFMYMLCLHELSIFSLKTYYYCRKH